MLIRRSDGRIVALDGREMAPAAATRDMYLRNGRADTALSQTGALASGVPGALATYAQAAREHGRKPLSELIAPATRIAEEGFKLNALYAQKLRATAADLRRFESSRAIFFRKDGEPLGEGDVLKQPDLARSYRDDPIAAVLYTDIERDGTEVGPNVATTAELARDSGLPVIASGGVGTLEHLRQLGRASREGGGGIVGAVLGRSLHERRFSLQEAIEAAAG